MKNIIKRTLATIMVVLMLLTSAPLQGFVELEWPEIDFSGVGDWFSSKASAADDKLTAEEAVDIYMKHKSVWEISKEELDSINNAVIYSVEYMFLDLDFDGILEMITSSMAGTGRFSNNRYYKINVASKSVSRLSIPEDNVAYYDGMDFYMNNLELYRNKSTSQKIYIGESIVGLGYEGTHKGESMLNYKNGIVTETTLNFAYRISRTGSNSYLTYNNGWKSVTKDIYNNQRDDFYSQYEDLNLKYKKISAFSFSGSTSTKQRSLLLESYKAFKYDMNYRETYGWPLANYEGSFGYPQNHEVPIFKRYREVYGINVSSLIESGVLGAFNNKWSGNCFGLSVLSLANYFGIIKLKDYFTRDGTYLYDYGYNSVVTYNQGNFPGQYFSVKNNDKVIAEIEKAHIMQSAVELRACRVYSNDKDYSSLIEHFSSNNPKPLLVNMEGSGFGEGHTMILTGEGGVMPIDVSPGWFKIKAYDTNAPANSDKLSDPSAVYERDDSYLYINPSNGMWNYFANGRVQYTNWYNFLGEKITFYDISKLDSSFFTKTLNLWYKKIQITFGASDITIKNKTGKTLFSIVDNEVKALDENCDYGVFCSGDDGNLITFYTDETDLMVYTSEDSQLWGLSKGFYVGSVSNSKNELEIDFNNCYIHSKVLSDTNGKNSIAAQNVEKNYATRVDFDAEANDCCTLTVTDKSTINTNMNKSKYSVESERVVNKPTPPKKITATQTTSTITLNWSKSAGATGYRVYQYSLSKKKYVVIASIKGKTSYTKSKNLKAGSQYKFKIKPYVKLSDGTVIWGSASDAFTTATKPKAPTKVTATTTKSTISLKWSASAGATGYRVYQYSPSKGKYVVIASLKGKTSYKKSKNFKANSTYKFKIKPYVKLADGTVIWGSASGAFAFKTKAK